jgi:hypothetical protein
MVPTSSSVLAGLFPVLTPGSISVPTPTDLLHRMHTSLEAMNSTIAQVTTALHPPQTLSLIMSPMPAQHPDNVDITASLYMASLVDAYKYIIIILLLLLLPSQRHW